MDIEQIRLQHDSITIHATALADAVSSSTYTPTATIRWKLARELIAHLAVEDRWLYPALIASPDKKSAETARQFKDEMGDLSNAFTTYMGKWTDQRIASEWAAYCIETKALLASLKIRVVRENKDLYPLAIAALKAGLLPSESRGRLAVGI